MTGNARCDARDEDVAARLGMPSIMAMVAFDRRVLGMIEASWQQKAGEHHDRRDMELTAGTVWGMAVKATALFIEDDAECSRRLLAHPGAPARRIARRRRQRKFGQAAFDPRRGPTAAGAASLSAMLA